MLHLLVLPIALAAVLAMPSAAVAAEGFVGVLQDGKLVRFQSDAPTGLSSPLTVRGVVARERLVALGSGSSGVYGIGSSARLYAVDPRTGQARAIGGPFAQGLRGTRFSLAVAPDGRTGRLLSDVGQSLSVDLVSGATADAPALHRDGGAPAFPSADYLADGRIVGVDMARRELLTETGPGTASLTTQALTIERGADLTEPSAFDVAADGRSWMLASFGGRRFRPQSILLPVERSTATSAGPFRPFLRRVVTFASLGPVPDDTRAPAVRIAIPRRLSLRALVDGRLPFGVLASEGGQATAWVGLPGSRSVGPALSTRDLPGQHRFRYFLLRAADRRRLRARVGRRVRVSVRVNDWAGNRVVRARWVRLTR